MRSTNPHGIKREKIGSDVEAQASEAMPDIPENL
jgi:hypothetical protein